jgi:hypothetical protein
MMKFFKDILDKIKSFFFKEKESEYNLEEIRDAFEDYIGLVIIEFEAYDDLIEDIEKDVIGKMIVYIDTDIKNIEIGLSEMSGKYGGVIYLTPTITGKFAEREDDGMMSNWSAKYKITFVGGDSIEYMDTHNTGSVSYRK